MNWYKLATSKTDSNKIQVVNKEQPLAASISRNGKKIYIDTDIPKNANIEGKPINLHRALIIHEEEEKKWMDRGLSQAKSHLKAIEKEHKYVREQSIDPLVYEKYMDSLISKAEKHPKSESPKDIDPRQKPVIDNDEPETIPADHIKEILVTPGSDPKIVKKVTQIAKSLGIPLESIGYGENPQEFCANIDHFGTHPKEHEFRKLLEKEFPNHSGIFMVSHHR